MDCKGCSRETKYLCVSCCDPVCNACAGECKEGDAGYDEERHCVGICSECASCQDGQECDLSKSDGMVRKKKSGKAKISDYFMGKQATKNENPLESIPSDPASSIGSTESIKTTAQATASINVSITSETVPILNVGKRVSEPEGNKVEPKKPKVDPTNAINDDKKDAIFRSFRKVFPELQPQEIHNYHFCHERNCKAISQSDLAQMSSYSKFQHKWLFDNSLSYCEKSQEWCIVYIDGKGMFCTMCREYDTKHKVNGGKQWNLVGNVRCRQVTIKDHLASNMHDDAVAAKGRHQSSYFDAEEDKKIQHLKNEVYYKVFQSLYWLAKEEMPLRKMESLLVLMERQGVDQLKYFQTRSEAVIRKMLILLSQTIVEDMVEKIRHSEFYGLLTDEVTDISNICQLVTFIKLFDVEKGHADTIFIDCSDLLSHSPTASPNADSIVTCISKKFQELNIEIKKLCAFVSDGAKVMMGEQGGAAQKIREKFSKIMINIHCICHRLALACNDTGDEYKFIQNVENYLIELWKFFKNSSKRLRIYITVALKSKNFGEMPIKKQKQVVKRMKKACRTRWLSLHAGVDAAWEEFEGLVEALRELGKDSKTGSTAIGLLQKINNYEFLGTLCLLKHVLPHLSSLSKTFQTGSLNFSRMIPAIEKCQHKLKQVAKDNTVLPCLKKELSGRLKNTGIKLTAFQEDRIPKMVQKYVDSITENINSRFPKESCDVLEAFSIFDAELIPQSTSSSLFSIYGDTEVRLLGEQFFPDEDISKIVSQWDDFKYVLLQMKRKLTSLKKQLADNKLNFKKTSVEWSLEHIVTNYQSVEEFCFIAYLARIAAIVPVTNAWPERGASAVKRIKSRTRSQMKNDVLNGLLHISINGPAANSREADDLIARVVDKYIKQVHYKVPSKFTIVSNSNSTATSTQTQLQADIPVEGDYIMMDMDTDQELDIDIEEREYLSTNKEVSDDDEDVEDDESDDNDDA